MAQVRDVYQRKIYALTRMNRALSRMHHANDDGERAKACFWANAWLLGSRLRQFKIAPEARHLRASR